MKFYGVDPGSLSSPRRRIFEACLPVMRAREELRKDQSGIDADDLYRLVLLAYDDEDKAQDIRSELMNSRMMANRHPITGEDQGA